jgi:hypothetical protein
MRIMEANHKFIGWCLCLAGLLFLVACGPKPGGGRGGKRSVIYGTVTNIDNEILSNIPLRFEVLTPNPNFKGFVRAVTDTGGRFSIPWDELVRKESLKPLYILHINYARDYLRNDRYEYKIQKCSLKKETDPEVLFVTIGDSIKMNIVVGHYLWVSTDKANVRGGPSIRSEEIAELYRATKLIMVEQNGEWVKVKIPTNDLNSFPIYDKIGWVYKPMLTEQYIPPVSYKERQRETIISQHHDWPANFVELIKQEKIAKGMTKEMIRASLGDPTNTIVDDSKKDKGEIITKWEYGSVVKKTVIFKNDMVQSWE